MLESNEIAPMKDNIKKEIILPQYKREIEYIIKDISKNKYEDDSIENALKDLALLQLSYEYMQKHESASGYPLCRGLNIPFEVFEKIEEIRK
jgi:hypothetical protein